MIKSKLNKQILINTFGGRCQICGYNKCQSALEFHHKNPKEKEFNISKYSGNNNITYEMALELTRVLLLCANCHRETHAGLHAKEISELEPLDIENFLSI